MKLVSILIILGLYVLIVFGVWHLWRWVLPQIWPTGPASFIQPGFWLFFAGWFLLTLLRRAAFGGGK